MTESGVLMADRSKDMQKSMLAAMDEIEKLWKQKKPLQRRQQMVLTPLMWQAMSGVLPEQMDLGSVQDIGDLVQLDSTPHADRYLNILAHSVLGAMQIAMMHGGRPPSPEQIRASVQLPLAALYIYLSARRFGAPNVFELREGLAEKLLLTEADQIRPRDVHLPFPGFYLQMPPGSLELRHVNSGWHKASFIGIAEGSAVDGPRQGRLLISLFFCEPNERSTSPGDDNAQVSFVSLPEEWEGTVEEFELTVRDDMPSREKFSFVRWQGQGMSFEDGHRFLRKLLLNFCLYLSSPHPDISPTTSKRSWGDTVDAVEGARRSTVHVRRQVVPGKNFAIWDVGRNTTRLTRTLSATDILVRGHWRRQVHGPGRGLRKVIWIEPFIRRETGEDVQGHDYKVERNASDE